jgi:hypothetical protein
MNPATQTALRWATRLSAWILAATVAFVGMAWLTATTLGALAGTENADAFVVAPAGPPEPLPEAPSQPTDDGFEPAMPPAPIAPPSVDAPTTPASDDVPPSPASVPAAPPPPGAEAPPKPTSARAPAAVAAPAVGEAAPPDGPSSAASKAPETPPRPPSEDKPSTP